MRKKRVKGGDQHPISLKVDKDTWDMYLRGQENRNRLINDLLRWWYQMKHANSGTFKEINGTLFMKASKELWE